MQVLHAPLPMHLYPLISKYSPQHLILKHPLSIFAPLNVRNQVSHPYKPTDRISILYTLIFVFLDRRHKTLY
jgi:hypothetical protein